MTSSLSPVCFDKKVFWGIASALHSAPKGIHKTTTFFFSTAVVGVLSRSFVVVADVSATSFKSLLILGAKFPKIHDDVENH